MGEISFEGQVAIVTGAGGGIGRTHALELGRRGAQVVVNDLGCDVGGRNAQPNAAEAVAAEIRAQGGTAIANHDSIATKAGADALVVQTIAAFGRVDALVNNAGIMRNALIEDMTDEDWDDAVATHLGGSFRTTRAVWPHMKARGAGRIVFTASSAGLFGNPILANYGAAKAGVVGLMNVAAIEGEAHGILCNAIMPNAQGRMAVRMFADLGEDPANASAPLPPDLGNSMDPAFNAPIAVYLASSACTTTRGIYSQCLGRVARVFVGVTHGWQGPRDAPVSVEAIAAHMDEIRDAAPGYVTPTGPRDELRIVREREGAFA